MNSSRKRLTAWATPALVALYCAFPSGASANDDIDIVCPCTVEFSNLTSVSFSFGIRNLNSSGDTGMLTAELSARKHGDGPFNKARLATLDLPPVPAASTRAVQKYTAAFNWPRGEGLYELVLQLSADSSGRTVESISWLADAIEIPAGGSAYSSVYFDGTPTIEIGEGSATVKLPVIKNGAGGTQADDLKLLLGTHSELIDFTLRIAEHDLRRNLSPGGQLGATAIEMSFDAGSLKDYVSVLVVNSENRTLLQEVVSVPEGEELPKREFATQDASMLADSDGDGVGDVNERLEGTDPEDAESTPPETTIDVLGMYLPEVKELYGGDPTTRLRHVVNLASIIFRDSGTGVRLRLVGMLEMEKDELYADGLLDSLGEQYGADIAILFEKQSWYCGLAPLGGLHANGIVKFSRMPLAFVVAGCGAGTTAHEIGHVMGLGHSVIQRDNAPSGTFRWARGHGVFQIFGTTMTYEWLYGGAPVLDLFSDPDRDCKGLPCGSAANRKDAADAVTALNATRFQIARIGEAKPDTDGDGVVDPVDAFPEDPDEHSDFDGDGTGDKADTDDDGDGIADADDLFPLDPLDWADADGDGVGDNADAFPDDPAEAYDTDGDGVGDNADLFPEDPSESLDTDNDGVGNNADAFPYDTREWLDTDGDGIGDNADEDADNDGVADIRDVYPRDAARSDALSYRIQLDHGANERLSLSPAGDVDNDDRGDFLIGAVDIDRDDNRWTSAAYLIAAADLEAADAADGAADRVVDLERAVSRPGSWKFVSERGEDGAGFSISTAGDVSGDGLPELLIGVPYEDGPDSTRDRGAAYLVSPAGLPAADAADGTVDGVVALSNIPAQANSWKFVGEAARGERAGNSVGSLGDINGDSVPDLVIGAPGYRWEEEPDAGKAYLISGQSLEAADMADGDVDGVIDLAEIASQSGSWKLTGEIAGDHVGTTAPGIYADENDVRRLIVHAPSPTGNSLRKTGAIYLIDLGDLSAADSADGVADGVVSLAQAALRPGSWQLIGEDGNRAQHGASIGDHDGDGIADVIVRVYNYAYFLSGADFAVADESDGIRDRVIVLNVEMEAPNSWSSLSHYQPANNGGIASGRIDGDDRADLIVHNRKFSGFDPPAFLVSGAALKAYEGTGRVRPDEFLAREGSWELLSFRDPITAVAMAGDVDSDGREDMLFGSNSGIYLINSADLDALDSADGSRNEIIDLGQTTGDFDQDGIDDITDPDDDDDGFPDFEDRLPQDARDWVDSDGDGVGDNTDAFPNDWNRRFDTDGDGIADRDDTDDDGDEIADHEDDYPLDTDNDGIDNVEDADDDGDGVADNADAFPLDPAESADFDGDGIGDNADPDDDNDGVPDADDAFPNDAGESVDTDGDGVGDNSDAFVNDPGETVDTDGDGQGNNADPDDDNDGTTDAADAFPLDAAETADSDGDGTGDNADAFPRDSSEWTDTDGDGKGNNADTDDDDDGYTDGADSWPLDAARQRLFVFRLSGRQKESLFGDAVASAGDVDSDGRTDLLVGAPGAPRSGYEDGRVHVVSSRGLQAADRRDGMRDGLVALGDIAAQSGHWTLAGKRSDDRLGYGLLAAGDISGDGRDDWLLGASGRNNTTAAAYVVAPSDLVDLYPDGSRNGQTGIDELLAGAGSWELTAEGQGHDFTAGTSLSLIDDTDGDGKPEFLIGTPRHSEDHDPDAAVPGAAYLVSSAHLTSPNAASSGGGNRIDLSDLRGKSGAWKFLGERDGDRAGASVSSAGDIDGDGLNDLVVGAYRHTGSLTSQGVIYLVAATDLDAADRADGRADRVIRLANVHRQSSSWKLLGEHDNGLAGHSLARGDLNGDGNDELVITAAGVFGSPAAVYVLPLPDLLAADAADGSSNGIINLSHVASLDNGWKLKGAEGTRSSAIYTDRSSGHELIAAPGAAMGDVNGDGAQELLIGIPNHYSSESGSTAFLISGAELASADAADGERDGELLLANIAAGENSWKFVHEDFLTGVAAPGDLNGDGIVDITMATIGNPWRESYGLLHIVSGAELTLADRQDGAQDGVIHPGALEHWYRSADFDLDGIEDALDADDDNDGVTDTRDVFPKDPGEAFDSDQDGIGNNADPDDDNDGVADDEDAFPFDPYESVDSDGDGVGNNADPDDDNDGVADDEDAFPLDFYESADNDGDGLGDNIDPDDDNDGIPDDEDPTPRGPTGYPGGTGGATAGVSGPARQPGLFLYRIRGLSAHAGGADFDGDGRDDIVLSSALSADTAYLLASADIEAADRANGARDRFVDLDRSASPANSWKISGVAAEPGVSLAGDVDIDGRDDIVVVGTGEHTYLIPMSRMHAADAADGKADRAITLGDNLVGGTVGAWRLAGADLDSAVFSLADINADGREELLVGAPWRNGNLERKTAHVASGAEWTMADGLDGNRDDTIDLESLIRRPGSFTVVSPDGSPGGAGISSAGDVDGDGYADLLVAGLANPAEGSPGALRVYLLSGSSMASIDARDGAADGIIYPSRSRGDGLWRFSGVELAMGRLPSSAGDVDGDGLADLLLAGKEGVFLIAGGDISAADAADGKADRMIEVGNALAQSGSYLFRENTPAVSGLRVTGVGDVDGDAMDDILAVRRDSSSAHLIAASDLPALATGDGAADVSAVAALPNSWTLRLDERGLSFDGTASSGDFDGDGRPDLILGARIPNDAASRITYVISSAQLADADRRDGAQDRSISLDSVAKLPIHRLAGTE